MPLPAHPLLKWQKTVEPLFAPQIVQSSPFAALRMALFRYGVRLVSCILLHPRVVFLHQVHEPALGGFVVVDF